MRCIQYDIKTIVDLQNLQFFVELHNYWHSADVHGSVQRNDNERWVKARFSGTRTLWSLKANRQVTILFEAKNCIEMSFFFLEGGGGCRRTYHVTFIRVHVLFSMCAQAAVNISIFSANQIAIHNTGSLRLKSLRGCITLLSCCPVVNKDYWWAQTES